MIKFHDMSREYQSPEGLLSNITCTKFCAVYQIILNVAEITDVLLSESTKDKACFVVNTR